MTRKGRPRTMPRRSRPASKFSAALAVDGGRPTRQTYLPYGRHEVTEADVRAVVDALRSDWLTTGPRIPAFEKSVAEVAHVREAVAVSNGTAALELLLQGLGVGPGDEVVTTPLTFAATANAVLYV